MKSGPKQTEGKTPKAISKKDAIMRVLTHQQVWGLPTPSKESRRDVCEDAYKRISKSGSDLSKGGSRSAITAALWRHLRRDDSKGGLRFLINLAAEDIDAIRTGKEPPNIIAELGKDWYAEATYGD